MTNRLAFKAILILFSTVARANSQATYDFIVVGAGAGGGAVARRLCENGKFNVLLIESGGLPKEGQDVPANAPNFLGDPDVTFQYSSIPQANAALRSGGVVSVVAGRMLGGTTSLNYLWVNRGHPKDWDNWAKVTGDESWNYENMLKYFRRSEDYKGDFPSDQHGAGGPITVSRPRYAPGLDYWYAAGEEMGYSIIDSSGPQKIGFSPVEFAKRRGRRSSSWIGYLSPILETHKNLQIMTNTNATHILFKNNRAVGVRFISNTTNLSGTTYNEVYSTKEIIISAGSYNSPLLLQRSGIGPRAVLSAANIPILKELPTGQNLQGHPAINLNFIINNASAVMNETRDLTPQTWEYFNTFGDGPYSSTRGATGQAFMASSVAEAEGNSDWPDFQLCMSHSTLPYLSGDIAAYMAATSNLSVGEVPMSSSIFLGRMKSRGSINLNPVNPVFGAPVIDFGYLTDSRDIQIMLDAVRETLRIYETTTSYKKLAARYVPLNVPGCLQFPVKSKDYWTCYIRHVIGGGCHPAGTNKMGRVNDPTSVVDTQLRVIGIEGLRVVDASIMPFIINANPHAAVYGIAEKAAEMILNRWEEEEGPTLSLGPLILPQFPQQQHPPQEDLHWQAPLLPVAVVGTQYQNIFSWRRRMLVEFWRRLQTSFLNPWKNPDYLQAHQY